MASRHNPASIPLLPLNAIACDSETTGLDTGQAHMIQLDAARSIEEELEQVPNVSHLLSDPLSRI